MKCKAITSLAVACFLWFLHVEGSAKEAGLVANNEILAPLTKIVPRFRVTKLPVSKAVEELWLQAGYGSAPFGFRFRNSLNEPEPLISLDVDNEPVTILFKYMADLSGSRWSIAGWDGGGLMLEFRRLEEIDDSELMVYAYAYLLNEKGRKALGMRKGMSPQETMEALSSVGVSFERGEGASALWNDQTSMLAVCVIKNELLFVRSVVRLANSGFQITKQSQTRKK